MTRLIPISFLFLLALYACRKESFITSPSATITLSADSLHFDTLFTNSGSFTQEIKIFNDNNQKLRIDKISLGGAAASSFRINADGVPGPEVENLEINANDSIYVFVTVVIDPSDKNLPFIVQDSLLVFFNGKSRAVQLDAWGQNAHFIRHGTITTTTTWPADKPYVILGGLTVNENTVLSIQKGARIYLHADAPFIVDGSLIATGDRVDSLPVVFTGDRLDNQYKTFPGSWPGIYFGATSTDNLLDQVDIRNAYQGIVAEEPASNHLAKLTCNSCIIDNCYDAGLIGVHSDLQFTNTLITNCGKNVQLIEGGKYRFAQCTVAAYSNALVSHKDPVLSLTNFINQDNMVTAFPLDAAFVNCVFWGDNGIVNDEVVTASDQSAAFNASFTNCLWKLDRQPEDVDTSGMIENEDPAFSTVDTRNNIYDFHPGENSPLLGAGAESGVAKDLEGKPRDIIFPAIGAYEATF